MTPFCAAKLLLFLLPAKFSSDFLPTFAVRTLQAPHTTITKINQHMRKLLLGALFGLFTVSAFGADWTTAGNGTAYSLASLSGIEESGLSKVADNVYLLSGNITVKAGDSFTLEPGVTLRIAASKVALDFLPAFYLGLMCNWLVCLAVWFCWSARSQTGAQSLRMIHWLYPITAAVKTACTST